MIFVKIYLYMNRNAQPKILSIISLILIVFFSILLFFTRSYLKDFDKLGYPGIFIISVLGNATVVFPMPTFMVAFFGGSLYNPALVAFISSIGAGLGELTGYFAGLSGKEIFYTKSRLIFKYEKYIRKFGPIGIIFLAAVPNPAFDLAGIISGLLKIPVWIFLGSTIVGKLIKFLTIAYLGFFSFR